MATIVREAAVAGTPDDVWAVLADFGGISRWASFVDHSCLLSDGTEGIGMRRRIQTGRRTVVETVTEWKPGERLTYAIGGLPPVLRSVTNLWQLRDSGTASGTATTVTITTEIDAGPRPSQRTIAALVGRRLGRSSDAMLAGLGAALTARQVP